MAALSLWDAAEQVGTSKSAIWRAIKEGRLDASRDDSGNFSVDPNEVMRVLALQAPAKKEPAQDSPAKFVEAPLPAAPANLHFASGEMDSGRIRLATLEAEIAGLKAVLAEVRLHRDELRFRARRMAQTGGAMDGATVPLAAPGCRQGSLAFCFCAYSNPKTGPTFREHALPDARLAGCPAEVGQRRAPMRRLE